jgi:hypothetical protein
MPVGKEKESQSEKNSVSAFESEHLKPIYVKEKYVFADLR